MKLWKVSILAALVVTGLSATLGCAERKHDKVTIEERQERGEVKDVPPGEMVVE